MYVGSGAAMTMSMSMSWGNGLAAAKAQSAAVKANDFMLEGDSKASVMFVKKESDLDL